MYFLQRREYYCLGSWMEGFMFTSKYVCTYSFRGNAGWANHRVARAVDAFSSRGLVLYPVLYPRGAWRGGSEESGRSGRGKGYLAFFDVSAVGIG
jgi:hypothetical protein